MERMVNNDFGDGAISPQDETRSHEIQIQTEGQTNGQLSAGIKTVRVVFEGSKLGAQDISFEVFAPVHTSNSKTLSGTWEELLGKKIEADVVIRPKNQVNLEER